MAGQAKSSPKRFGELLGPVLEKAGKGSSHTPEAMAAVAIWPFVAGPEFDGDSRAVNLKDGKLFVEVRSPVWKQELLLRKGEILRRINRELGMAAVSNMVFIVRDYASVEKDRGK